MTMRFLPVNVDAVLVELDDLAQTLALFASLQAVPIAGIEELVPAARTVLVRFRPAATDAARLAEAMRGRDLATTAPAPRRRIEIPVHYDGEDLAEVAERLGMAPDEVVRRHTGSDYAVAFTGFAPGFAYLTGGDPALDVPRRSVPRTRIRAGAVGLAGGFSGVYPRESPGGWQIIGTTDTPMWDLARPVPALLQPGDAVRFVVADTVDPAGTTSTVSAVGSAGTTSTAGTVDAAGIARPPPTAAASTARPGPGAGVRFVVLATGLQALFQDAGRAGQAGQGVSPSGAMDRRSLQAANRLVGNPSPSICIEATLGGLRVRCDGDAVVVVTGAETPLTLTPRDAPPRAVPGWQAVALAAGDTLAIGAPRAGVRSYLAVRGGFDVAPVLGSGSTDTLSGVGPQPLAVGDVLVARPVTTGSVVGEPEAPAGDLPSTADVVELDVVLGPRDDWFTADAVARFLDQPWHVTPQSNRVGLRLAGALALERSMPGELPSEGTLRGSIQVPPSGQPVLFMADHPLTGGYPVIASVATHHLDRAGQAPAGARLRFRAVDPDRGAPARRGAAS